MTAPILMMLTACTIRYTSVQELQDWVHSRITPDQSSAAAVAALESFDFRCRSHLRSSATTVCTREAQGIPCKQIQGVSFPASSPAIGIPEITLSHVCL